jgi:hypothetical protein
MASLLPKAQEINPEILCIDRQLREETWEKTAIFAKIVFFHPGTNYNGGFADRCFL